MNRGELRAAVQEILGETTTADFWPTSALNIWLNEAYRRFIAMERWPWLATEGTGQLTDGDPDLELEEGVAATRHLNVTLIPSDTPTRRYTPARLSAPQGFAMRATYTNTEVSEPEFFYITSVSSPTVDGQYVYVARFVGTPNQDIDVEYQYFRATAPLDSDVDVPDIPVEFHMALAHYTAARAWEKELGQDAAKAREQDELFAFVLDQCRTEWLQETEDDPLIVGGAPPQYGEDPASNTAQLRRISGNLLG